MSARGEKSQLFHVKNTNVKCTIKCVFIPSKPVCSSIFCLFVQFNCSFSFSNIRIFHVCANARTTVRIIRSTGKLYGGKLNVTHMGTYSADAQFLNISFKETTIIRRLNVHGIKLRVMTVVSTDTYEHVTVPIEMTMAMRSHANGTKYIVDVKLRLPLAIVSCLPAVLLQPCSFPSFCCSHRQRTHSIQHLRSTYLIMHTTRIWIRWIDLTIVCSLMYGKCSILGKK